MKNATEIKNKLISIIREYLVSTNSKQNPQLDTYSIQDLKKVCFVYGIKMKSEEVEM